MLGIHRVGDQRHYFRRTCKTGDFYVHYLLEKAVLLIMVKKVDLPLLRKNPRRHAQHVQETF